MVDSLAALIRSAILHMGGERYYTDHEKIVKGDLVIDNEMYKREGHRKMHIEVAKTGHLDIMHVVFFPDYEYNIPIFGADIIATPSVVTAAICDISPVRGTEDIYKKIQPISNKIHFPTRRPLPLWGDEIFSPFCKFLRLKSEEEKRNFYQIVAEYLFIYMDWVKDIEKDTDYVKSMLRMDEQIYYSTQQRKNPKTLAVLSNWFDEDWANNYIDNILFCKPNVKHDLDSTNTITK